MDRPEGTVDALKALWAQDEDARSELEQDCAPNKTCRNMKDVSFDGMAGPGSDLRQAWRERLQREGKLHEGAGSLRDLVLGTDTER